MSTIKHYERDNFYSHAVYGLVKDLEHEGIMKFDTCVPKDWWALKDYNRNIYVLAGSETSLLSDYEKELTNRKCTRFITKKEAKTIRNDIGFIYFKIDTIIDNYKLTGHQRKILLDVIESLSYCDGMIANIF